jgi:hypothetical protein
MKVDVLDTSNRQQKCISICVMGHLQKELSYPASRVPAREKQVIVNTRRHQHHSQTIDLSHNSLPGRIVFTVPRKSIAGIVATSHDWICADQCK